MRARSRAGNQHVRRVLVESAWSYRFRPNVSRDIAKRNEGLTPDIQGIAWKAQHRLYSRYNKLLGRGKSKQQTVTALARELAGFVWAISRAPSAKAA